MVFGLNRQVGLVLSSAILTVSAFVVALKLLQPASIRIYLGNSTNSTILTVIPQTYTQSDVALVCVFSLLAGASAVFILLSGRVAREEPLWKSSLEEKRKGWEETSKTLKDDERRIYEAIAKADGIINQGELPEKTGLSKATVSRALFFLESKGLVERRRRGMGNVVSLK